MTTFYISSPLSLSLSVSLSACLPLLSASKLSFSPTYVWQLDPKAELGDLIDQCDKAEVIFLFRCILVVVSSAGHTDNTPFS